MRIALLNGSTYHWLAGSPWIEERVISSAADFKKSGSAEQEIVPLIGATHPAILDKKNLLNQISFRCYRQLGSPRSADQFIMGYEDNYASTGTLLVYSQAEGVWIRRDMANAIVAPPTMTKQGGTVILDYEVVGGNITSGTSPLRASLTADPAGTNNTIIYTARDFGPYGNTIRITYVISGTGSAVLSVAENYPDIIISAGSNTTAQTVISAVNASAAASAYITAAGVGTVTGVIAAYGPTFLAGGTN